MDYLQQATERARREREGRLGKTPEPGVAIDSVAAREATATAALAVEPEAHDADTVWDRLDHAVPPELPTPAQVRYVNTRKVEPDEATLRANRVIADDVYDQRVEVYRQLRSQVLNAMKRQQWRTLAITSAHENAGKTLTALNLAIAMSQEVNQTVMLVDLDLRKPNLHTTLGLSIDHGIVDHLEGRAPLEQVLLNPGFPRLVVLPGLPQGRHASEVLTSPAMKAFLGEVTSRYPDRLIIFDLPPLLRNDDAMVFVPTVDCCLLVVEDGVTTPEQIERSRNLLRDTQLLGAILNKSRDGAAT